MPEIILKNDELATIVGNHIISKYGKTPLEVYFEMTARDNENEYDNIYAIVKIIDEEETQNEETKMRLM